MTNNDKNERAPTDTTRAEGRESYPDDIEEGWPDDDNELPLNEDRAEKDWKVPYPDDEHDKGQKHPLEDGINAAERGDTAGLEDILNGEDNNK